MDRALAFVFGFISLTIVLDFLFWYPIVCPVKFPRPVSLRRSAGGVIGPSAVLR